MAGPYLQGVTVTADSLMGLFIEKNPLKQTKCLPVEDIPSSRSTDSPFQSSHLQEVSQDKELT